MERGPSQELFPVEKLKIERLAHLYRQILFVFPATTLNASSGH
jgi:hypothetical protein